MHSEKNYIVIVNYNGGADIINCIKSIIVSSDIHPHIVVVDNASRDQSLESVRATFPKVHCIYNSKNIGFAAAANIGARFALERGADTVTFCNPDVILEKKCLSEIHKTLRNSDYSIISPVIYKEKSHDLWFSGGFVDKKKMRAVHKNYLKNSKYPQKNTFISGCIMTVTSEVFAKTGLLDEQFFLYYEDADYSLRAVADGFSIGLSHAAIAHHKEVSEQNKELKTYHLVYSGLLFFKKHLIGWRRLWFLAHYKLRKIKNKRNLKKDHPLAKAVCAAYRDFDNQ